MWTLSAASVLKVDRHTTHLKISRVPVEFWASHWACQDELEPEFPSHFIIYSRNKLRILHIFYPIILTSSWWWRRQLATNPVLRPTTTTAPAHFWHLFQRFNVRAVVSIPGIFAFSVLVVVVVIGDERSACGGRVVNGRWRPFWQLFKRTVILFGWLFVRYWQVQGWVPHSATTTATAAATSSIVSTVVFPRRQGWDHWRGWRDWRTTWTPTKV